MKQIELKPCPFCGGKVELKDKTSNFYGFNGYEIKCNCGCVMKSDICSEMIFEGNKCSTPVTERGKSKALSDLVALWNGSADRKQRERGSGLDRGTMNVPFATNITTSKQNIAPTAERK